MLGLTPQFTLAPPGGAGRGRAFRVTQRAGRGNGPPQRLERGGFVLEWPPSRLRAVPEVLDDAQDSGGASRARGGGEAPLVRGRPRARRPGGAAAAVRGGRPGEVPRAAVRRAGVVP